CLVGWGLAVAGPWSGPRRGGTGASGGRRRVAGGLDDDGVGSHVDAQREGPVSRVEGAADLVAGRLQGGEPVGDGHHVDPRVPAGEAGDRRPVVVTRVHHGYV